MSIEIFNCEYQWSQILITTLPSANPLTCDEIPLLTYPINQIARLIKLTALTYYNEAPALGFVDIDYTAKDCIFCPSVPILTNAGLGKVFPEELPYRFDHTSVK